MTPDVRRLSGLREEVDVGMNYLLLLWGMFDSFPVLALHRRPLSLSPRHLHLRRSLKRHYRYTNILRHNRSLFLHLSCGLTVRDASGFVYTFHGHGWCRGALRRTAEGGRLRPREYC